MVLCSFRDPLRLLIVLAGYLGNQIHVFHEHDGIDCRDVLIHNWSTIITWTVGQNARQLSMVIRYRLMERSLPTATRL